MKTTPWGIFFAQLICLHRHTIIKMHGSRRLVDGQVDDDLHEVEVCTDCGTEFASPSRGAALRGEEEK
jgi:hypothetical protein